MITCSICKQPVSPEVFFRVRGTEKEGFIPVGVNPVSIGLLGASIGDTHEPVCLNHIVGVKEVVKEVANEVAPQAPVNAPLETPIIVNETDSIQAEGVIGDLPAGTIIESISDVPADKEVLTDVPEVKAEVPASEKPTKKNFFGSAK